MKIQKTNIMLKSLKFAWIFVAFAFLATSVTSCYKKKDTTATITVINEDGSIASNKKVDLLWENLPDSLNAREGYEQHATTDGSGKANFNFNEYYESGQAGVFVLDIVVEGDILGVIKIEQETNSEETVTIEP